MLLSTTQPAPLQPATAAALTTVADARVLGRDPWFPVRRDDGEERSHHKCSTNANDARNPPSAVEGLPQYQAAHKTAEEVSSEINPAGSSPIRHSFTAYKASCSRLREKGADTDESHASDNGSQIWGNQQR
jgi:hypothetical protein